MYAQFIAKVHEVMQKANEMYNIDIKLDVQVNIRGSRIAGCAERKLGVYRVRLNPLFCQQQPEDMMNDTIPHEIAHIVCFALKCDDGHGPKWKKIAKSLGSTGQRTCDLKIIDPKKTYYYVVFANGAKVDIGQVRYNQVMAGKKTYTHKVHGKINKDCKFEIVSGSSVLKEVKEVKAEAKEVKKTAALNKPAVPVSDKVLPKPAKASAELFAKVAGNFDEFAAMLDGKTAQYIKDQFKRAAFHA